MKIYLIVAIIFITGGNSFAQQIVELYQDSIPNSLGTITEKDKPTITIYLPAKEKANGTGIVIFPGGAYWFVAIGTEGTPIAQAFSEKGFTAFVVKYRLPKDASMRDKSMGPLMDAQQAIKCVRDHAKEYNVDSNKIGIIGYSAGGHLASTLGTHYQTSYIPNKEKTNLRPDFMMLIYPVISMQPRITHEGSFINLLGRKTSEEKIKFFSNEEQVTADTPPTYLTHTADDSIVDVNNSIEMYNSLRKKKVKAELHLFPIGNHGFTQRLPVNEWLEPMLLFLKKEGFYNSKQ